MYLVFIYYAYVYNVLHFILNQSINQSVNQSKVLRSRAFPGRQPISALSLGNSLSLTNRSDAFSPQGGFFEVKMLEMYQGFCRTIATMMHCESEGCMMCNYVGVWAKMAEQAAVESAVFFHRGCVRLSH